MNNREASILDTIDHIREVQLCLAQMIDDLQNRSLAHDKE